VALRPRLTTGLPLSLTTGVSDQNPASLSQKPSPERARNCRGRRPGRAVSTCVRHRLGLLALAALAVLITEVLPHDLGGLRDRALLLGFAGALRRSELVALAADDVGERPEGLVLTLRRSKTDQEATGRPVGVPYGSHPTTGPVRALQAWSEAAGTTDGPLFRPVTRHGRLGLAPRRGSVSPAAR
jgi:hypothetical protein